jgi:hypothetical protein
MKLVKKFLGIVAVIAVIGFITLPLTGCPEDVDDGDKTVVPVGPSGISMADAIPLTEGVWANGNISTANGEQWFKFTATASTQYIHFDAGTLTTISVQLYDADDGTVTLNSTSLNSTTRNTSGTLVEGDVYYIKGSASGDNSGTFKIAFNTATTLAIPLPTENVTELNEGEWADGNIPIYGEQWFKFTATASTQYIHFNPGTLGRVYVQLYDDTGVATGVRTYMSATNISRTITSNSVYYIKVMPFSSGAYQIAFNTSTASPPITLPTNVTELNEGEWADGNIPIYGEQWFKLTATAATQYIHFNSGTLSYVIIQLYDDTGTATGSRTNLYSSTLYTSRTLTNSNVYYIRVEPSYSNGSGDYKILFNKSQIILPTENVTELNANTWSDGNIPWSNGEQWFKFTATATTQYIHVYPGTLRIISVQLYDDTGAAIKSEILYSSFLNTSITITSNSVYYIRVTPYNGGGAYQIAFNTSTASPPITLPTNVTELTEGVWANGNIPTSDGEQWFKFTTTANTQYIHFADGSLDYICVLLYKDAIQELKEELYNGKSYTYVSLSNNSVYYIRVTPPRDGRSGAYKIAFSKSSATPTTP